MCSLTTSSSIEEHLCCFQTLAIINNATMNIVKKVSLRYGWASFGHMPKSGISGFLGRLILSYLRNRHIDFQSCFSNMKFFILAILRGVRWYPRGILICISLINTKVEHFCKCISGMQDYSVENSLFKSVSHFNGIIWYFNE